MKVRVSFGWNPGNLKQNKVMISEATVELIGTPEEQHKKEEATTRWSIEAAAVVCENVPVALPSSPAEGKSGVLVGIPRQGAPHHLASKK